MMTLVPIMPHIQAALNLTAICLMTMGYYHIRQQNKAAHRAYMIAALITSFLFLIIYLIYHSIVGNVQFAGQGWIRPIYFSILASHVLLAALIVPLILITVSHAIREKFTNHRRFARWTLPLWLYVSVTGVIVYIFAFHIYP